MPLDPAANFIRGTTDSAVASTDTTISVADASIFPDPTSGGEYNLVCWDADTHPRPDQDSDVEIVRVTGRDTTTDDLTVARGQEGTSNGSHPSGAALQLSPTAKMFGDIDAEFDAFWDSTNSELTADVNTAAVTTDDATVGTTLTDPAAVTHTGALADASDVSSIQSSSDVDHDSTTGGTVSDAHHTKTSSASELTDVSADSVGDAHHGKTASGEIDHDQTTNRTHSGDDLTPQSVSADEALNSAIGDSVNYIDPRWLARTDAFIFSDSELNISNYEGGTSGSGSKGDAIFGTELSTGTTSGSSASLINGIDPSKATPLWDKSRSFRTAVDIQTDTTSRIDYYTTGRPQNGSDGFGFKLAEVSGTPTLQGVVHNGVSETTTDLITSPGTGKRNLRAEYTAGSDVTFYVDGTNEGAISSGLPSGSDEAVVPCVWYVENTSGVDRGIKVSEIWMVQLP